jgi:putative hydrolase of the HAD superfamily
VRGREVLDLLHGAYRPEMIEALTRISKVLKTGCITNNMPSNKARPSTGRDALYAEDIMAIFDHVIESAKIGVRKPDPRIYRMMCDALKVEPANCVFLDDLGVNLKPAREMGMKTIKVIESWQAINELEALTHIKLKG